VFGETQRRERRINCNYVKVTRLLLSRFNAWHGEADRFQFRGK